MTADDSSPARRPDPLAWAVFAVLAAVYRWGRCPSYGAKDSPGTVFRAVYAPGRDPLARLGHLAAKLPFDSPEGWVNSLSGLFHAGAAALLFALLRRLGIKRVPALGAAVLLAFLHQYWYYALVAGRGPAAVFGLALAVWSVIAWKEESRAWPLALGALGAVLAAVYAPRASTLVPFSQWLVALAVGLLLQRLELQASNAALGALAGFLAVGLAHPYDLRSHNPTQEWARAAIESAQGYECIVIEDAALSAALRYESRRDSRAVAVDAHPCIRPLYDPLTRGARRTKPNGVLFEDGDKAAPGEYDARARRTLSFAALTSVGRRDRAKYSFAGEDGLYERYAAVLRAELYGVEDAGIKAKIGAQLADYAR